MVLLLQVGEASTARFRALDRHRNELLERPEVRAIHAGQREEIDDELLKDDEALDPDADPDEGH